MRTISTRSASAATALASSLLCPPLASDAPAGFHDGFDTPAAAAAWSTMTGDGDVRVRFSQSHGIATIDVDARADRRNIWWALIRHPVTPAIDPHELERPDRELRIEVRVRTDTAPRRINLHANHSRTTDFHSHLREYDLPVAGAWQMLSMTTGGFDARAGDEIYLQLALMDWGLREYRLDIDYIRASVVDPLESGGDLGRPLPYRPAPGRVDRYAYALPAAAAGTVNRAWPETGGPWRAAHEPAGTGKLLAGPSQVIVLRWDAANLPDGPVPGWGVLELVTDTVFESRAGLESFAELRVTEVLGGSTDWHGDTVTLDELLDGAPAYTVINEQPVIDVAPQSAAGARTRIPLSPPVLERLLCGRTRGLAISSHGGVLAVFRNGGSDTPVLYFDTTNPPATRAEKEDDNEH